MSYEFHASEKKPPERDCDKGWLGKALDVAEVFPYALYYAAYEPAHAINKLGEKGGIVGSVASHIVNTAFVPLEAIGLGGDALVDVGEKLNSGGKIGDEGHVGSIVPLERDKFKTYLPGIHPDGHIDFEW